MFTLDSNPRGLRYLNTAVAGHCFAWYVLYNLCVFWLLSRGHDTVWATSQFGNLVVAAYMLPLLGGVVADGMKLPRWMQQLHPVWRRGDMAMWEMERVAIPGVGFRCAALLGAACGLVGFATLSTSRLPLLGVGLVTVAVGLVKPALASMVGRMFPAGSPLADAAFAKYYSYINVGAVISPLVGGWLSTAYSFSVAFAVATLGYVVAVMALLLGWRHLAHTEQKSSLAAVISDVERGAGYGDTVTTPSPDGESPALRRQKLVALWIFFGLAAVAFWPAYNQNGSGLNIWALSHTHRTVLGHSIPAAWFAAINSVFCIAASSWLIRRVSKYSLSTSTALGYVFMTLSFLILVQAPQTTASPLYLVAAITLSSFSEILISTVGLAQVARLAPRSATSTYMALWYCTVAVGGKIAGTLSHLQLRSGFVALAALCTAAGIVTLALRRRLDINATALKLAQEAVEIATHTHAFALHHKAVTARTVRLLDHVRPVEGEPYLLLQGTVLDVVEAHCSEGVVKGWWCRRQGMAAAAEWLIFAGEVEMTSWGDVGVGAVKIMPVVA